MAVRTLQRSFAAGEISPECYGRLDLVRYQTGLAIARNFITLPHGPAMNRAGFKYILEVKDSTKQVVLLPFSFNTEQTYILEFGDRYIRFHTNGGTLLEASKNITGITQPAGVATSAGHGYSNGDWVYLASIGGMTQLNGRFVVVSDSAANTFRMKDFAGNYITTGTYGAYTAGGTVARVYEIASPYLEADLFELHIAQSADVLTITHPDYAPRELSRLSATSWSLAEIAFTNGPFQEPYTGKRKYLWTLDTNGSLPLLNVRDGSTGDITVFSDDDVFTADDVDRLLHLRASPYLAVAPWESGKAWPKGAYVRYGDNYYLSLNGATSGNIPPTHTSGVRPDSSAAPVNWLYVDSGFGTVKITSFVSTKEVKATVQTGLSLASQYGFVNAAATAHTPTTTWTLSGTGSQTQFAIAGAVGQEASYYRVKVDGVRQIPHDEYEINATTDKIDFFVAPAAGANNIVVEEFDLSVFSIEYAFGAWGTTPGYPAAVSYFGGRIAYGGSDDEPQDIWLSKAGSYKDFGTSAAILDSDAIDVALADFQVNRVRDLVALKHLVVLTSSRAWNLVGDQDNVLTPTATAEPGEAVGISTVQAEVINNQALYVDAVGNAVHKLYLGMLDNGEQGYLSEDLSILAEHLTREKTIVDIAFQRKPYPILWCVRSDGYLLGLTYNPRHEVVAWHQHLTDGTFESVAVVNEGTEDALYAVVKRTINGRTVRYVERMQTRRFTALEDCFFVDAGATYDGAAVSSITNGLWHLEGETVVGLADGAVFTKTVTNGTLTLDAAASTVHIGLGYTADLQTLPLALQVEAAAQGMQKNVRAVDLRLVDSSGIEAGPDFDHLSEMLQREDETYGSAPNVVNGQRRVPIDGTWTDDGQVCVRQANPLPAMVSAIVLEVALGS